MDIEKYNFLLGFLSIILLIYQTKVIYDNNNNNKIKNKISPLLLQFYYSLADVLISDKNNEICELCLDVMLHLDEMYSGKKIKELRKEITELESLLTEVSVMEKGNAKHLVKSTDIKNKKEEIIILFGKIFPQI